MNKYIKKAIIVFILLLFLTFTSSCQNVRGIDEIAIVIAIGIDIEDGDIIVTSEVVNPLGTSKTKGSEGQENTDFVISKGKSIREAMAEASITFDRKLYFPHVHIVVLGEEIVKEGSDKYIDILDRDKGLRETAFLVVAKDAKAYEVMGINSGLSDSPGRYMYEVIKEETLHARQRPTSIADFFKYFYHEEKGYVLGVIDKKEKKTVDMKGDSKPLIVLCVEGGAVFKNSKLKGYFTGDEMIGFNFITDEFKGGVITFKVSDELIQKDKDDSEDLNLSLNIFRSKTKRDIRLVDGGLHLYIDVKLRGVLEEVEQSVVLENSMVMKEAEERAGKKVEFLIKNTIKRAKQDFEVDTFGIGEIVHRKYPKLWREINGDWVSIFKDMEYTVNVDTSINQVDFTNNPPQVKVRGSKYD